MSERGERARARGGDGVGTGDPGGSGELGGRHRETKRKGENRGGGIGAEARLRHDDEVVKGPLWEVFLVNTLVGVGRG